MSFSKPKISSSVTPSAPPPPPPADTKVVAPSVDKVLSQDPTRKGTRSLRIDRTSDNSSGGSGVNLPL